MTAKLEGCMTADHRASILHEAAHGIAAVLTGVKTARIDADSCRWSPQDDTSEPEDTAFVTAIRIAAAICSDALGSVGLPSAVEHLTLYELMAEFAEEYPFSSDCQTLCFALSELTAKRQQTALGRAWASARLVRRPSVSAALVANVVLQGGMEIDAGVVARLITMSERETACERDEGFAYTMALCSSGPEAAVLAIAPSADH